MAAILIQTFFARHLKTDVLRNTACFQEMHVQYSWNTICLVQSKPFHGWSVITNYSSCKGKNNTIIQKKPLELEIHLE